MTHKHFQKGHAESGQIIMVIAFLMIAMIAMLGLAIDGGGLMFLQRDLQNAGDAAILAGTYAQCSGGDTIQITHAAREAAKAHGFEHGVDGVVVNVDTNYTPPGQSANPDVKYMQVKITSPKETYFIQIVYSDALSVTTESVGRCNVSSTSASAANKALFAACVGSNTGIEVQASNSCSGEIIGGVHSNSDAKSNGGMCGSGDITTSGDPGQLKGTYNGNPLPSEATGGVPTADFPVDWDLSDYNSASAKYPARIISQWGSNNYSNAISGINLKIDQLVSTLASYGLADPRVEPVLIYVNGDVTIRSGSGSGTLYLTIVATGQIRTNGNISGWNFVNAGQSPSGNWASGSSANGMDYLLFYADRTDAHSGSCKTGGNTAIDFSVNNIYWDGILYAPNGDVTISGSSSETSYGAIWAQAVKYAVSGMTLTWDPNLIPPVVVPPTMGIAK